LDSFGINDVRALVAAMVIGLIPSTACAVLPSGTSGLICTAPSGARLRPDIYAITIRFQKEGFAVLPILAVDAGSVVLSRFANDEIVILAGIDRRTLVYTALLPRSIVYSWFLLAPAFMCLLALPPGPNRSDRQSAWPALQSTVCG
jgi:hypothetical protein